jgi:hypothetical protein
VTPETADYFDEHRDDLAGEEVPSRGSAITCFARGVVPDRLKERPPCATILVVGEGAT